MHGQLLQGSVSQHLHATTCTSIKLIMKTKDKETLKYPLHRAKIKNIDNAMC